jgi:serine/threonine-protein kinase
MDRRRHVDIGLAALAQGYLDLRSMTEALVAIGAAGDSSAEAWVHADRLTRGQLDMVLALLDNNGNNGGAKPKRVTRVGYRAGAQPVTPAPHTPPRLTPAPTEPALPPVDSGANTAFDHRVLGSIAPPTSTPVNGTTVPPAERYTRLGVLGSGGMGEVHEFVDTRLGRRIAVKALRRALVSSDTAVRMLEREARVTGSLQHPNIIPVYDAGRRDDLGPFYAMRLIEQPSLEHVLDKLRHDDPEFVAGYSLGRLLRYFVQVCQAVDYAHSRGVIHCDLKPANILLGSFGEVLVVDWGLAYVIAEGLTHRGGTPGYLAPEQLAPSLGPIDARTDIFALGAVLYEILCLDAAFPDSSPSAIVAQVSNGGQLDVPARPGTRRPGRSVASELEDICMQALELEPAKRHPSAHALAAALEAFLEGTREKERRHQHAVELVRHGDELAEDYRESIESRPERVHELRVLRDSVMPWEPAEKKRALWDAEDRLAVVDALGVRTLHAAAAAYELALDEVPGHPEARRGLARLYHDQMQRAQERRDELERIFFEELVRQHDDGQLAATVMGEGTFSVNAPPRGALVRLAALEERERRLVPTRPRALGHTPVRDVRLPPGSYVATLEREDGVSLAIPLLVRGGQRVALNVDLRAAADREPGECYIPAGPALLGVRGEDPSSTESRALREVVLPAYYLAERPVTFAEYLEFIQEIVHSDADLASACLPRASDGAPLWDWRGTRFEPARVTEFGERRHDLLRLPAFGMDAQSASIYAAWRSRHTGRSFRLPTEAEWEKAARGVDGRIYPWGDRFDAGFCKMRESRPGRPMPEASGSFADDISPFGVRDLAGGVADWVVPTGGDIDDSLPGSPRIAVTRGGAWCDWRIDCRLDARRIYQAEECSPRIGFRLARSAE